MSSSKRDFITGLPSQRNSAEFSNGIGIGIRGGCDRSAAGAPKSHNHGAALPTGIRRLEREPQGKL